jgi:hypothetical protein
LCKNTAAQNSKKAKKQTQTVPSGEFSLSPQADAAIKPYYALYVKSFLVIFQKYRKNNFV